jgi:hypothetical protein
MGQALAGFPTLDRGSSTTTQIHSVPTRAYQIDQPSLQDVPVSDNALEIVLPVADVNIEKGERDLCFFVDINNHISALLRKSCNKKQEN